MPSSDDASSQNDGVQEEQSPDEDIREEDKNLMNEILYCVSSFHAIVTPVAITMILSALAVVNFNTDETRAQGEAAFAQSYQVLDLEEGNAAQNFGASVANVLIMVSVICCMTFVIVILYKYGCMKIFNGYMILVTTMLLGYFTSNMLIVAIQKYQIRFDKISFAYLMWNYAVVGVLAIFFHKGIPTLITQIYLVTSSVVLAWQLSYLNDWTAWTLLVGLALYDLFAVLSPYGPLRKLTQLMSRPGAQPLSGLLYEASLPVGVQRPSHHPPDNNPTAATTQNPTTQETEPQDEHGNMDGQQPHPEGRTIEYSTTTQSIQRASSTTRITGTHTLDEQPQHLDTERLEHVRRNRTRIPEMENAPQEMQEPVGPPEGHRGKIPLAIAKLYKLAVVDEEGILMKAGRHQRNVQREFSAEEVRDMEWSPRQLRSEITVVFPHRGGRIVPGEAQHSTAEKRYLVYNRNGELARTFIVNQQGKVMQVVRQETDDAERSDDNTIKLGLGDFIFYSVLVSKAALQSYSAFMACTLTVLCGLGATLVLLAVHGKALPGT